MNSYCSGLFWFCSVLFCLVLLYSIVLYFMLFHSISFYLSLFYFALFSSLLPSSLLPYTLHLHAPLAAQLQPASLLLPAYLFACPGIVCHICRCMHMPCQHDISRAKLQQPMPAEEGRQAACCWQAAGPSQPPPDRIAAGRAGAGAAGGGGEPGTLHPLWHLRSAAVQG